MIIIGIDCYKPANGETISIKTRHVVPASISVQLLKDEKSSVNFDALVAEKSSKNQKLMYGVLLVDQNVILNKY
jgi:hypothetical protein